MGEHDDDTAGSGEEGESEELSGYTAVRISKKLHATVKEFIGEHPDWAWGGLADFVRDAIRYYMAYVRRQDDFKVVRLGKLPKRVLELAEPMMDIDMYERFRKDIVGVVASFNPSEDPDLFFDAVVECLGKYIGRELAGLVVEQLYMAESNSDSGERGRTGIGPFSGDRWDRDDDMEGDGLEEG